MNHQRFPSLGRLATSLALVAALLLATCLGVTPASAIGPTLVDSNITTNTTWTVANSPYLVTVPISITSAATLTIEPGVEVEFLTGASLQIDGGMQAKGKPSQPVLMHAAGDTWAGLKIVQPAGAIRLESVTLRDAETGLTLGPSVSAPNQRIDIIDSLIESNRIGLNVVGSALGGLRLTLRNNLFTANSLALLINGLPNGQPRIKLEHNSFNGNGIALKALNFGNRTLKVQQQWWGSASGPEIISATNNLTCTNSVSPAPGTVQQEIICGLGNIDAVPFSKIPAGRRIVKPGEAAQLETGVGSAALSDNAVMASSLLTVSLPLNTFAQPVDLLAAPLEPSAGLPGQPTLLEFEITAVAGGKEIHRFNPGKQITVEVTIDPADLNGADPSKLALYYFDEQTGRWDFAGITSFPDPANNRLVARLEHLTRMRITSVEMGRVYLPMAEKN